MSYPVPNSLSPSRVESFTKCPLAFRFASIEKLPEPPSIHATKGSFVHRVLELLYTNAPADRLESAARVAFDRTAAEYAVDPDLTMLHLDEEAMEKFLEDSWSLVQAYFRMEDPTHVNDIGLELRLEAQVGDLALRGIIDRLDLDEHGELIVNDYKTGRAPSQHWEQQSMGGVHFYSFLCESVLGRRPAAIKLLYLRTGEVITAMPSEQSVRFITTRTTAVWKAVERACVSGNFLPRQSSLCSSCSFQQWCPQFGGDPALAAIEAPIAFGRLAAA